METHVIKILSVVAPVFFIIGLGYFFARFKKLSLEPIIDIMLYLTIPALVLSSLSRKSFMPSELGLIALATLVVVLGTGALSRAYLTITKQRDMRGFYLPAMFMNTGNMSFPLALLAFGADGLAVSVLYYVSISVLVYTLGIYIAKGKGGFKEVFKLPLIYAAAVGIFLNFLEIKLPAPVISTVDMLGAATIPIMQISLGYRLHSTHILSPAISFAGSLIRILGGLLVAYVFVSVFGIEGLNRKIILLSSTMPSAVINFVITQKYDVNSDIVASIVITSTLLSIISTPILLLWIMD